jgi:hypothetical protein
MEAALLRGLSRRFAYYFLIWRTILNRERGRNRRPKLDRDCVRPGTTLTFQTGHMPDSLQIRLVCRS